MVGGISFFSKVLIYENLKKNACYSWMYRYKQRIFNNYFYMLAQSECTGNIQNIVYFEHICTKHPYPGLEGDHGRRTPPPKIQLF